MCVLHHQGGSTRVEPCVPMSERQVERLARRPCSLRGVPDGAPAKADVHRARARNRTHDPARIVLPSPAHGTESAEEAIRRAQTVATIRTVLAGAAHQLPAPGEQYIDTSAFLAHAVSVVRSHGFHRSGEEDATWRAALTRLEQGVEPANEDLTRAGEIRDWASQLRQRDDDELSGETRGLPGARSPHQPGAAPGRLGRPRLQPTALLADTARTSKRRSA